MQRPYENAISEVYGLFLLALLIAIVVLLILSVSTGFVTSILQKPPVFTVDAKSITLIPGKEAIYLIHGNGDPVALSSISLPDSPSQVIFILESPCHEKISVEPSDVMTGHSWASGGTAIIFFDGSAFHVTDDPRALLAKYGDTAIRDMPPGTWLVYIMDKNTRVVVNSFSVTV